MPGTRPNRETATLRAPSETDELPRWDLTALYPGVDSAEFAAGFEQTLSDIDSLARQFDEVGVGGGDTISLDSTALAEFEHVLSALNLVEERLRSLQAYLYGTMTADTRDEQAQARFSQLQERSVALSTMHARFNAWVGRFPIGELVERSPIAAAHAYPLRTLHASARYLMSEAEEALAAELSPSSGAAWSRLHDNLTAQITAEVEIEGETRGLAMSEVRNLAMHPDRELRRRAYLAELAAWERNTLPIAAALNGIKGQVLTVQSRRGWADPLDETLFWSGIDAEILDAMVAEARAALPDFRRYMRLKAKVLGISELAWYDLFAPVGNSGRTWSWPDATAFITEQFAAYSGRLAGLARRAFTDNWIDAGPRPGKVGGAYCMWLLNDQSRILGNFSPGYDGVAMLAHELGHAYHNLNETGRTPLQRRTPMTLAETASTFCETVVKEAALVDADTGERLYILEQSLQGANQIVVDILSRFDFERAVFAGRRERDLSVNELNRLMLEAQDGTYGDGLAADARHQFMWAVKGHYYNAERSYYNFPYLFGMLFGLGLYDRYRTDPEGFPARYDALLASTGLASASDLAAQFDIDLRSRDFWRSSLDVIRADINRFEELAYSVEHVFGSVEPIHRPEDFEALSHIAKEEKARRTMNKLAES
jgi:pepF/M3 family oligoendopeptidase